MSRRVVSLVPSSTETLLALGADVIACTRFCEQPDIAHVGGTKNPDVEAIVALSPDVVALDREENRIEDHDALIARGVEVVVTDVRDVASALDAVDVLAVAAGVESPAGSGSDVLALDDVASASSVGARRRAFVPIWRRPWMTIGPDTYGADVLARVGVDVVAVSGDDGTSADYPEVELSQISTLAPDLVLVPSEPYEFRDEHLAQMAEAIPTATVHRVDGQDLFWWGSRTPGAISRLARAVAAPPSG